MKRWLLRVTAVLVVLVLIAILWCYANLRDRHPGYLVDLDVRTAEAGPIKVGFSALPITPTIHDRWTDANGDARFSEDDGDTYQDGNGNGRFDPFWIAGFGTARAANGVHDDLWARAIVIDDSTTRLAIVSLDAIGLFLDDVVDVRKLIPESLGVTYSVITSTHVHEAPDLLGLWGPTHFRTGVNPDYRNLVKEQAAAAIRAAVESLRPARLRVTQELTALEGLVTDTRRPVVKDPGLRLIHAVDAENGATLGLLVAWANHPETVWDRNLLITSDFPHYVREGVEKGIFRRGQLKEAGLGGIAVYVNGAIGGLMTTNPRHAVPDPFSGLQLLEPTFQKAQFLGEQVALAAIRALAGSEEITVIDRGNIRLRARTIELPLENPLYRLALALGVVERDMSGWMRIRSEIAAWTLGELTFVCLPGEVYPELVEGGIERSPGQDFELDPVEVPPLRALMPGKYKFVLGLANDEIGYIIPKSEWDEEAPYLYDEAESPYGEINSLGPDTAPILHREVRSLLQQLSE